MAQLVDPLVKLLQHRGVECLSEPVFQGIDAALQAIRDTFRRWHGSVEHGLQQNFGVHRQECEVLPTDDIGILSYRLQSAIDFGE